MPNSNQSGMVMSDMPKALEQLYQLISTQYYDTGAINQDTMIRQSLSSFVNALWDPFSSYLPPVEWKELTDSIDGNEHIEGIWALLSKKESGVLIEEVMKWSPAAQAGIKPFDMIIKVNGSGVQQQTISEVVQHIRGASWTPVTLTIARTLSGWTIDLIEKTLIRDKIVIPSVSSQLFTGSSQVGSLWYIALSMFAQDTNELLQQQIQQLIDKRPLSWLILDLRWNGWWLLPESVDVASHFLPLGTDVVSVKYRLYADKTYKAEWNDNLSSLPLVILVDDMTASASEIITLALKEGRCKVNHPKNFSSDCSVLVVWEKTFGKWSIQNLEELSFGWSLKLTVGKWFSPSGKTIDHIGIDPDVITSLDKNRYQSHGYDSQLEQAKSLFSQK